MGSATGGLWRVPAEAHATEGPAKRILMGEIRGGYLVKIISDSDRLNFVPRLRPTRPRKRCALPLHPPEPRVRRAVEGEGAIVHASGCRTSVASTSEAQTLQKQAEGWRWLPSTGVVEVVAVERLAPVFKHAHQRSFGQ